MSLHRPSGRRFNMKVSEMAKELDFADTAQLSGKFRPGQGFHSRQFAGNRRRLGHFWPVKWASGHTTRLGTVA